MRLIYRSGNRNEGGYTPQAELTGIIPRCIIWRGGCRDMAPPRRIPKTLKAVARSSTYNREIPTDWFRVYPY
jgi:hypothetical protein